MSEHWARRNIAATIFVGLLTSTITLGIFLLGSRDQEIGTRTDASSESSKTTNQKSVSNRNAEVGTESQKAARGKDAELPTISISSIHVSEVAMDIPAAFELGIKAGGITNMAVHDIDVILDFGRAEIEVCDYTPESAVTNVVAEDKSRRQLKIEELRQEEKLYIRCLISSPVFDQVIIRGGNTQRGISIDFEQYQASLLSVSEPVGFWAVLGYFFVIFFSAMICFKIIGFLFG